MCTLFQMLGHSFPVRIKKTYTNRGREAGREERLASHLACSVFGITIRRRAFAPRGKIFLFFKLNKCNVSPIVEKLFSTQFLQWLATDTPQILNPKLDAHSPRASHYGAGTGHRLLHTYLFLWLSLSLSLFRSLSLSLSFCLSLYIHVYVCTSIRMHSYTYIYI